MLIAQQVVLLWYIFYDFCDNCSLKTNVQILNKLHILLQFHINRSILGLGVYCQTGNAFWIGSFGFRHLIKLMPTKFNDLFERSDDYFQRSTNEICNVLQLSIKNSQFFTAND